MAEHGWPWDGREFGAGEIANAFECVMTNGVMDAENDFLVSIVNASTGLVRVGPGTAWIGGRMYRLAGYIDVELVSETGTHDGPWYGGALVLRCDTDNKTFAVECKLSDIGDGEPALSDSEIMIARYYRYRSGKWTNSEIKREVVECEHRKAPLITDVTRTTIKGLIKGGGDGYITEAIPGVDYKSPVNIQQGTFLPQLIGNFGYSDQSGYYYCYDGIVVFTGTIKISSKPSTSTGMVITGLPIKPLNGTVWCCNIAQATGFEQDHITGQIMSGSDGGAIIPLMRGQSAISLTSADMTGQTAQLIGICGCYLGEM